MRILIVGNDPKEIGGVANYTRPLANRFAEMGHKVFYLYSGAYASNYNLRLVPYIRRKKSHLPFECFEVVNSTCLPFNFGYPELDTNPPEMNSILSRNLDRIKPDIVHIHSRFGFPAAINKIASDKGIRVLNTIHVYGYICQRRVMIDHKGNPCAGPSDSHKCAVCTGSLDYRKERLKAVLRNYGKNLKGKFPSVFNFLQLIKDGMKRGEAFQPHSFGRNCCIKQPAPELSQRISTRLKYCKDMLNCFSDCTICVSNDVKKTLMRYGVDEGKLLVQHIGSSIAENQFVNDRPLHDPIVIGNIGGVNQYKGIHVLVEAASKLRNGPFKARIFGKYDEGYVRDLMERFPDLPIEFTGRYRPENLPEILKQIDIMVLPSICNDTAPQTIFESFSGGVPIIASDIGGFPDFVKHDHNGLLFKPGNSGDLAAKIDLVLSNPERLVGYRKNIPRLKTITENAHELISLYSELVALREGAVFKPKRGNC